MRYAFFHPGGFMNKKCVCVLVLYWIWQGTGFAGTVTDQAGRRVRVDQPVERVVTTFIPATLFALCSDLGNAIVGASTKDTSASLYEAIIDPENPPVLVGNRTAGLSLETIFSLKPDLVIMYGQKDGIRMAERLTSMGVPAIVIMPESMAGIKDALDLIGRASGKKAHTDRVVNAMTRVETLMAKRLGGCLRHKTYYASSGLLSTISGQMLQNEMIRMAGGINVSEQTRGFFVTVSREQLLSWNPEVIIASDRLTRDARSKLDSPEFCTVQAVREKKIFRVPAETYWDFPSPLAVAGVLWMAANIHPKVFSGKEVRFETERLYDTIFGKGFSGKYPIVVGKIGGSAGL